jgi:hypothetical protein
MVPKCGKMNMNEELWGFFVLSIKNPAFDGLARIAPLFTCNPLHHSGKRGNRDSNLPTSPKLNGFFFFQGLFI